MIRAVGPGDGDLAVLDGDGVLAVHGELLVDGQVNGLDRLTPGDDPGEGGLLPAHQGKAEEDAGGGDDRKKNDPVFRFQSHHSCRERL